MILHMSIYAALLTFLYIFLFFRIVKIRRIHQISLGDGGQVALQRASRAHGNFIEYVPLGLFLLFLVEMLTMPAVVIHLLGASLLIGRLLHAYSISQVDEKMRFRVIGSLLTLTMLAVCAVLLVVEYVHILWRTVF